MVPVNARDDGASVRESACLDLECIRIFSLPPARTCVYRACMGVCCATCVRAALESLLHHVKVSLFSRKMKEAFSGEWTLFSPEKTGNETMASAADRNIFSSLARSRYKSIRSIWGMLGLGPEYKDGVRRRSLQWSSIESILGLTLGVDFPPSLRDPSFYRGERETTLRHKENSSRQKLLNKQVYNLYSFIHEFSKVLPCLMY